MKTNLRPAFLLSPWILCACADGGDSDAPVSEVTLAADHRVIAFSSLAGFLNASNRWQAIATDRSILSLRVDATYQLVDIDNNSATGPYTLAEAGNFTIYQPGSGRTPTYSFLGAYQQAGGVWPPAPGTSPDLVFTDRITGSTGGIGIYLGQRVETTPHNLVGDWHYFSHHVMLDAVPLTTDPTTVGRGAYGTVAITATGTDYHVEGTAEQTGPSENTIDITLTGPTANLQPRSTTVDDWHDLRIDYDNGGVVDPRTMIASTGPDLILALDANERTPTSTLDSAAGIVCMMRKFATAPTTNDIAGEFLVGGHTTFVKPENPGSDAFVGQLTLRAAGTWELVAAGRSGESFDYSGTWTQNAQQDGGLTFTVTSGAQIETWRGAISRSYETVIVLDPIAERRTATPTISELNFLHCIRKRTPQ